MEKQERKSNNNLNVTKNISYSPGYGDRVEEHSKHYNADQEVKRVDAKTRAEQEKNTKDKKKDFI